ncbi:hypothetical protein OAG63_00090 [Methylacidiphilales bacterium]|nr:hypothetical protein [Candidatus Methylacidiphilales bacterium]
MKNVLNLVLAVLLVTPFALKADDQAGAEPKDPKTTTSVLADPSITPPPVDTRYGIFDALDKRSVYGQGVFPEPFLVDDSDGESDEGRLDWLHTGGPGNQHTDYIHGEVEKGFGLLTLELETAYERDSSSGEIAEGMDNVDLGARYPFYQWVSRDGDIDNSVGLALEVGIPTHTQISHSTEIVPKIFDDLKFKNFTLQSILGYSTLIGPSSEDGGVQNFEYGFVFGYTIDHDQLAIPGLQQLIPVVELNGARQMNKDDYGSDNLEGDVGFRANLDAIGTVQPRLGIVFVFPVDYGARQDQNWGIDTSLVFEY